MEIYMKTFFIILIFFASNIFAKSMEVIKEHSTISFEVEYMKMTTVTGTFKNFKGQYEMSDDEKSISQITFKIETLSVDTNDAKRDFHLKGHEFLFSANYPDITFSSIQKIPLKQNQLIKISGILVLRGIKKEITFEGRYKGKMIDPWKKENYFFELNGTINRKDFGINWNKELDGGGFLIGDLVKLKIIIQAQDKQNKTSFSTHMIPSTKGIIERDLFKKGKIKKITTSTEQH
jgi:polyisoprenoid-binding protein YceI